MLKSRQAKRGALIGLAVGAAAALLLLTLGGFSTSESMEGAMYLALPLSFPIGLAFLAVGVGDPANTWLTFIAMAIPLNFAAWGAVIGLVRAGLKGLSSRPRTDD
jgi:hypothetical protein